MKDMDLTNEVRHGYTWRIAAIVAVGFGILLTLVRLVTCVFGGFFYARSFDSQYGGLGGGASARRFLGYGIPIPFSLPPEFGISDGWNINQGASS